MKVSFLFTFGEEAESTDTRAPSVLRSSWSGFEQASKHFDTRIEPGETARLGWAADTFAAYLAQFHAQMHQQFAHCSLACLPATGELGDPDLATTLEIVIAPDGSLNRVGVIRASGQVFYDFVAFRAVILAAPYPPTPTSIRSPDGQTYVRWTLHRNESQCGTWNAEPYILRDAVKEQAGGADEIGGSREHQ